MKKIVIGAILFVSIFTMGCNRNTITDFTQYKWKLQSVSENGIIHAVNWSKTDYYTEDAYKLIFIDDSLFQLNSSCNLAMGFYHFSPSVFEINAYAECTFVYSYLKIDQMLVKYLPTVHSYKIKGNSLILIGDNCRFRLTIEEEGVN